MPPSAPRCRRESGIPNRWRRSACIGELISALVVETGLGRRAKYAGTLWIRHGAGLGGIGARAHPSRSHPRRRDRKPLPMLSIAGNFLSAISVSSGTQKKRSATSWASAARSFFRAISASCLRNSSKLGSFMACGKSDGYRLVRTQGGTWRLRLLLWLRLRPSNAGARRHSARQRERSDEARLNAVVNPASKFSTLRFNHICRPIRATGMSPGPSIRILHQALSSRAPDTANF